MIRREETSGRAGAWGARLLAALLLCAPGAAVAGVSDAAEPEAPRPAEAEPAPPPTTAAGDVIDERTLQSHRTVFEALSERLIGVASRAVRYDWRKATVEVAVLGSQLLELNNFNSARIGASLRTPLYGLMLELAVTYVHTWGSFATEQLSRTPYRQAGRPSRLEADLMLGYPLAEGVTTPRFSFLPATELVFLVNAGIRYRYYPHQFDNMPGDQAFGAFFSSRLNDKEVENLEYLRLPGMAIDRTRYEVLLGFSLAVYFQNGAFIAPRITVAPPLFALTTGSTLIIWWDMSLALGWSF